MIISREELEKNMSHFSFMLRKLSYEILDVCMIVYIRCIYIVNDIWAFDEGSRGSNKSFPENSMRDADSRRRKENEDRLYFSRLRSIAEMHGVEYVKSDLIALII